MNLIIVMVDPVPYYRICARSLCESIDCELYKNSQFTISRFSQSKPDLWYCVLKRDKIFAGMCRAVTASRKTKQK